MCYVGAILRGAKSIDKIFGSTQKNVILPQIAPVSGLQFIKTRIIMANLQIHNLNKALAALMLLSFFFGATGLEPRRGYRGFVEWDNNIGNLTYFSNADGYSERECQWFLGLSTVHGYQINSNVFVGAGALLSWGHPSLEVELPVFVDFRYDTTFNKLRPFGDIRIGYNFGHSSGTRIYFSPTVGHRFSWSGKTGLNLGLGMSVIGQDYDKHRADVFFTFRLGIDF